MTVHMRAAAEHRRNRERGHSERWQRQARCQCCSLADDRRGETAAHRRSAQQRARGISELGSLAYFETLDPRDAGDSSCQPSAEGNRVDSDDQRSDQTAGIGPGDQSGSDLGNCAEDEEAGNKRMLGVDAGGGGVDDARADRGHHGNRQTGEPRRRNRHGASSSSRLIARLKEAAVTRHGKSHGRILRACGTDAAVRSPSSTTMPTATPVGDCDVVLRGPARSTPDGRSTGRGATDRDR